MGGIEITALSILVGLFVWYLKYQTKQQTEREKRSDEERAKKEDKRDKEQKEEKDYYRGIISGDLRKNADLNNKSIILIKDMNNNLEEHNGHSQKAWEKTIDTLSIMCDKLNGGSPTMTEVKKRLHKDRRKENKPVTKESRA